MLIDLLSGITDDQDRSIFISNELCSDRRSLAELAEELGISHARVAQRRDRAAVQVREELAAAPAPLEWLVECVRRSLGRATTTEAIRAGLRRFGFDSSTGHEAKTAVELLLWLAGPFEPVTRCPGWRCVQPDDLLSRTREMLTQDGGIRSLAAIEPSLEELGVVAALVRPWLNACGAAVVDDDLAVWLSGSLVDVLERLIDASGRGLTFSECRLRLLNGGRSFEEAELQRALRGRRFRQVTNDVYELRSWPRGSVGGLSSKLPSTRQQSPAGSGANDSVAAFARERETDVRRAGELSRGAFPGAPGQTSDPVPDEQLGLPGMAKPETACLDDEAQAWGPMPGWAVTEPDGDDSASRRAWLTTTVDDDLMRGGESAVPDGVARFLGIGWRQHRTFSSRYGPVRLANDGPEPRRGPLRPIVMAAGAGPGDVLVLGFAPGGDVVVEVRAAALVARPAVVGSGPCSTGPFRASGEVDETTDATGGAA